MKNLIQYPFCYGNKSINGLNFTDNGDGSITVSGKAQETTYYKITETTNNRLERGEYFLHGNSCGIKDGCELRISNGSQGYDHYKYFGTDDTGEGVYFSIDYPISRCYVYIRVEKGSFVNSKTIKPVLLKINSQTDVTHGGGGVDIKPDLFSMIKNKQVTLSNGLKIPMIGIGTFRIGKDKNAEKKLIFDSISTGYRLIDTAASYKTEDSVGEAVKSAIKEGICTRKDIVVSSKMKVTSMMNYYSARQAIDNSLEKLGLSSIDLYLLHQAYGDYFSAWRAIEDSYLEGKIKAIGVCNFYPGVLANFCETVKIMPMVNQIETHPFYVQKKNIETMRYYNIVPMAWSPLGGGRYNACENEEIIKISEKYKKNFAQVLLRWNIQRGVVVVPKSSHIERIKGNLDVWDFCLTPEEMETISSFDMGYTQDRIKQLTPEFTRARLGFEK